MNQLISKILCAWMAATLVIAVDPCAGQGRIDLENAVEPGGTARRRDAVLPNTLWDSQTDVNLPSWNGLTPLMSPVTSAEIPAVGYPLDEEINIGGTSADGQKDLICRAREANPATVKPLVDNNAACFSHNDGFTPLTRAIWSPDPTSDTVESLLKHGANPNARDKYGFSPLARAIGSPHPSSDVVRLLLQYGADPNAPDIDGFTLLAGAICGPHPSSDVVRLLLQYGADPNAPDRYGVTPLMRAAWKGHARIARILVEEGANVNQKDNNGRTPLLWAVWKDYPSVVLLLLNHGADVNARDVHGWTPLRRAESASQGEIVEALKAHGARK